MLLQHQDLAQNYAKIKRVTKWVAMGSYGLKMAQVEPNRVINPIIQDLGPSFKINLFTDFPSSGPMSPMVPWALWSHCLVGLVD